MNESDIDGFDITVSFDSKGVDNEEFNSPGKFLLSLDDSKRLLIKRISVELDYYFYDTSEELSLLSVEFRKLFEAEIVREVAPKMNFYVNKTESSPIDLFKDINFLIRRGVKFGLIETENLWTPSREVIETLVADLHEENIPSLPSFDLRISESEDSCRALEAFGLLLGVGWPIDYLDLLADFSKPVELDWEALTTRIYNSDFSARLTHIDLLGNAAIVDEQFPDLRQIVQLFSAGNRKTTVRGVPNITASIISAFFDESSAKWGKNIKGALKTLEIYGPESTSTENVISMRGPVCTLILSSNSAARALLERVPILINEERTLRWLERLYVRFDRALKTIPKDLLSTLGKVENSLISVSIINGKDRESIRLPRELQKKLAANLAEKMKEWTENGTEVRYGRMKLMVIGNGQAGKTTTIRSLLGKKFDPKIESTVVAAAETDVSITVKDVSFSRWQEVNIGTNWVGDEMADYFHRLSANPGVIVDSLVKGEQHSEPMNFKGHRAKGDNSIEEVWLKKPNVVKTKKNKQQIQLKNRAKGFLKKAMNAANVKKMGKEALMGSSEPKDILGKDNGRLTIWDFGGQEVFYALHHLYLTTGGLYILTFNLRQMKDDTKSELDILEFWLESVSLHAPQAGVILVGTRCDEVEPEDLKEIDGFLLKALEGKEVECHYAQDFCFYPIDNSDKKNIQSLLQPLKQKINYCFNHGTRNEEHVWQKEISLSWMYFMNFLVTRFEGMISSNKLIQAGESMNLNRERDIIPMLSFYKNAGAIIPFMKTGFNKEPETSDYIVLSPDWLLGALGCFIYDPILHRKNKNLYGRKSETRDLLQTYETSGIIPDTFLSQILNDSNYSEIERDFLMGICKEMLLMSKYKFKLEDEGIHWLVPSMNRTVASPERIMQEAAPEDCFNVYIHWGKYIPRGLYERVICVMLLCNEAYGGSVIAPFIFSNFCGFYFRETQVFVVNERETGDFRIAVDKTELSEEETINMLINLLVIVEDVVRMLNLDILGKELNSEIQIEVDGRKPPQKLRCSWNLLKEQITEKQDKIVTSVSELGERLKSIVLFEPFTTAASMMLERALREQEFTNKIHQEEVETVLASIVSGLEQDMLPIGENLEEPQHIPIPLEWEWSCFMAHTWGPGNVTHKQVLAIRNKLEERNIKTWTDEFNLKQYISFDTVRGLRKSSCVLVFVTQFYLEKVNNPNTHVAREFKHATLRGSSFLVPVILDENCLQPETWLGSSAGYHLQDSVYYDLSSEEKFEENFDKLVSRINEYSSRPRLPNSYDTPPVEE